MVKKLGAVFGLFFIVISLINYINNPIILRINVIGLFILGALYLITTTGGTVAQILQVGLLLIYGCVAMNVNDGNSLVSLISYAVALRMYEKYSTKTPLFTFILPIPYITTAVIVGWEWVYIVTSTILYITYTTVMYIINNDKV